MSSVTLRGTWMTLMGVLSTGRASPLTALVLQSSHMFVGSLGLQWKGQPATCSTSGSIRENELTSRDFPVPLGPEMRAPPMVGSTALITRTVLASSWSTTALKG